MSDTMNAVDDTDPDVNQLIVVVFYYTILWV